MEQEGVKIAAETWKVLKLEKAWTNMVKPATGEYHISHAHIELHR